MTYRPLGFFDSLQVYRNRDYMCWALDRQTFDSLNESGLDGSTVRLSCAGCLDAVRSIPTGSCAGTAPTYIDRDDLCLTPEERKERDDFLDEMIKELRNR